MKLTVYKGFDEAFLAKRKEEALTEGEIGRKLDVLRFDKSTRRRLNMALVSMEEESDAWITYEEYTLIRNSVEDAVREDGLELVVWRNNLYPEYYPLAFEIGPELKNEIISHVRGDAAEEPGEACSRYLAVYHSLVEAEGVCYGGFYNYEYDREEGVKVRDFYAAGKEEVSLAATENAAYDIFANEDIETYLRDLTKIRALKPSAVSLRSTGGEVSQRIEASLRAYCAAEGIRIIRFQEEAPEDDSLEKELADIAQNHIGIRDFKGFRPIKFYKNPDMDKEVVEISQSRLIREIIRQAENAYPQTDANPDGGDRNAGEEPSVGKRFRDIFITASTGAGKSVIFQIPAVYLAKKYRKLTIIIEPVKALMQDQKEKLNRNGYTRVETFNSDLISQVEKEEVLKRIREGEVDLLYLSPETLLSYSIETIIGDRDIGLLIVDEAHIVTTWGVNFRPDYWYLGEYINRLRNQIQTASGKGRRVYRFPICAFTATAVNGGADDSVSDTVISLYMENPIKYIGYVRRDDIQFQIHKKGGKRLSKTEYETAKAQDLNGHVRAWLEKNEKTIVYFPYASFAMDASRGVRAFAGLACDKRIGVYTGRNVDEVSAEDFNGIKRETFENFRRGRMPVVFATKAFGMGVDVDDVKNVYHYAVTGNLCDYVQEVGRAARKPGMEGAAVTDFYPNDLSFMKILFGMSRIRQYQIKKVLEGIYDTYKSKKGARNFLISPESFTYIFNGKGVRDEDACINKLKTCLLMLEKDLYDKYTFKVMISRPQSVFTKAFVVVNRKGEAAVLNSRYGKYFKFMAKGRQEERQADDSMLSDTGDIFSVDLKGIWEEFYPNISFPQFKYLYFNPGTGAREKTEIMPSIRDCFSPRQKVTIEARGEYLLSDLRDRLLEDFEYIADTLYAVYHRQFFTAEEFARVIRERYGLAKARIIANSLFELVDPNGRCAKHRSSDASGQTNYSLSNGNFKEYMRRPVIKSKVISNISRVKDIKYSSYISLTSDENSNIALKLMSIFGYINYEIVGGEEPEIFIRLNDPERIRKIVMGNTAYSNSYVTRANEKHERDVAVLVKFFNELGSNQERWDFIEEYFLGGDVVGAEQGND